MENKKIILVPTDFSDVCLNAINYGAELSGLLGYSLIISHIIDKKTKSELKKENLTYSSINKKLESLAKKTSIKYNIPVSSIAREGDVFSTVSELAKETAASLLILGAHGKNNLKQKIAGSYAKKLLITCPIPVIVIQKGTKFNKKLENIVFPVSTTAEVRQKVKWAVIIAKAFNSKIHIFQLFQKIEEDKNKMQIVMDQIINEFNKNKISYICNIAKKDKSFSQQVIAYANENKADMINIMTTPDLLNLKLSSYDDKIILNQYEIPVMCVNPVETTTAYWF